MFLAATISIFFPTVICVLLHERRFPHPALELIWVTGVLFLLGGASAVALTSQETSDERIEAIFHAYTSQPSSLAGLCIGLIGGLFAGAYLSERL